MGKLSVELFRGQQAGGQVMFLFRGNKENDVKARTLGDRPFKNDMLA